MNRESLEKLRLDRRLLKRRGWIGAGELNRALEQLPDVGSKATTLGAEADARGEGDGGAGDGDATPSA